MKKLIIYGSGGHGKVIADAAEKAGLTVEGWIDNTKSKGAMVHGYPVLGDDDDIERIVQSDRQFVIAIGDNAARERLSKVFSGYGAEFACIMHPSAIIARGVEIPEGSVVCALAVINPGAVIGVHAIINTGAIIEHDCFVGDFAHIASGVAMGGHVKIGAGTLVGTNATILTRLTVGKKCVVGAGAVVVRVVPDGTTLKGNPAK
jgi:acetyltransferase EpsM